MNRQSSDFFYLGYRNILNKKWISQFSIILWNHLTIFVNILLGLLIFWLLANHYSNILPLNIIICVLVPYYFYFFSLFELFILIKQFRYRCNIFCLLSLKSFNCSFQQLIFLTQSNNLIFKTFNLYKFIFHFFLYLTYFHHRILFL